MFTRSSRCTLFCITSSVNVFGFAHQRPALQQQQRPWPTTRKRPPQRSGSQTKRAAHLVHSTKKGCRMGRCACVRMQT